jgi:CDP-diacylglycerol---glycerol-3-phosphate 3-phosphatidyltransferase
MNLYAAKGAINARLVPLVDRLAAAGLTADALTLAAVPVALAGAVCLVLSPTLPALLLLMPLLCALRLLLNLLDGQLARRTGSSHPRGELYNEIGDRLADVLLLTPVALLPGAQPETVFFGVICSLMASYVGITARAAGSERIYRGLLSKPGRMALLAVFAVSVFAAGPGVWWAFGPLLLIGGLLTFVERLAVAIKRLP